MGWVPGTEGWEGSKPGPGPDVTEPADGPARAALHAGFAPGGQWDTCAPGPELAAALADASGPQWRCPGTEPDQLIGVLRGWAALQSWASAGMLGVIRQLIRDDDLPAANRPRHGDLPDAWSDSVNHELALALASSVTSAQNTALLAWELGARLPGVAALLASGTLTQPKARMITEAFRFLSDEDAARAEALLLPQLAGATGKTYGQLAALAARIAVQVDPGTAERRRKAAEKHLSRVAAFREESGAAGLSGRELPPDETLAAYANVNARALEYKESGAFRDARLGQLRSAAYLDLLNGTPAWARVAAGRLPGDDEPDSGESGGQGPGDGGRPDSGDPDDSGPGTKGPGSSRPDDSGPGDSRLDLSDCHPLSGSEPGDPASDTRHIDDPDASRARPPRPAELVIPLATLLGIAHRPGEAHGFGALDPALCRYLAASAARSPNTTLCLTVTDPDGAAFGHGCVRPGRWARTLLSAPETTRPPDGPSALATLPARINLTVTAELLSALMQGTLKVAAGSSPQWAAGWSLAPPDAKCEGPPGDPDWCGNWALTLPGGVTLPVRLGPVPTLDCDHRHESHGYQPSATLRHLVQVRDYQCTFPSCSRHARDSDFEHCQPYHKGGRTCACNAGARSRKCHQVKQSAGWNVTQPRPGWHQWQTPAGLTYTQAPNQYPVLPATLDGQRHDDCPLAET